MPVDFDDVTDEPMAAVPDEDGDVEVPLEEEVVEQRILRKRREKTTSMTSMTTVTTPAGGEKQGGGKVGARGECQCGMAPPAYPCIWRGSWSKMSVQVMVWF